MQAYHPSGAILDYATTTGAIVAFAKGLAQLAYVFLASDESHSVVGEVLGVTGGNPLDNDSL